MSNRILSTVKEALGVVPEYTVFDSQIIMYVNTVFSILHQLGVGPDAGFSISNQDAEWPDYLPDADWQLLEDVKTYIVLKTRLLFDPPTNGSLVTNMEKLISELEWRINVEVDPKKEAPT